MTCVARLGPGSKVPNSLCGAQVKGQTEFCGRHKNYLVEKPAEVPATVPGPTVPISVTSPGAPVAVPTTNIKIVLTINTPTPANIFNKKFSKDDFNGKRKVVYVDGSTGAWKVVYMGGPIETSNFYCNCPNWLYQTLEPKLRVCKHITGLITGKIPYTCETPKNLGVSKSGNKGGKTSVNKKTGHRTPCMLADVYKYSVDPTGWWSSEKFDGVRAFWDTQNMYTRNGNKLKMSDSFRNLLPKDQPLDGELWVDYGKFTEASTLAQGTVWERLKYQVFDIPDHTLPVEARIVKVKEIVTKINSPQILAVTHTKCTGRQHLKEMITEVVGRGGEGLVLRQAGSMYEDRRTQTWLKYKLVDEMEGEVIELVPGIREGLTGSLRLRIPKTQVEFSLGGTLPLLVSSNPPKIGDMVTFNYRGMTHLGTPKFATFKCIRTDLY